MPPFPEGSNRTPLNNRWPSTFEPRDSMFAPGEPLVPTTQEPVRSVDFPVGVNTLITPKAYEGFSFAQLRNFANVELVRLAIETRKDQIFRLSWKIKPKQGKKTRKDADERIRKVERFWQKPDGVHHFDMWLHALLEDVFVLDAPALEMRRTRGGELIGLELVPGDTVKILVDHNGRKPLPPAPAYQQIIKGRVWANLTSRELFYFPRNPRVGKLYGYSVVEQIIITINTLIQRQASQLAYFTSGNVPAGIATVPDTWTVDQVKDWQEWMDSTLSGNLAERRKILWAPAGSQYKSFKEAPIKDEFDEWLARVVCYAFSLPPTPFIRQMNRSTAFADNKRALEEGLIPLLTYVERLCTAVTGDELGCPDLEFAYETDKEIDAETQAKIDDINLRNASTTLDEVRDRRGDEPYSNGFGKEPIIYTGNGAIPLEWILDESANPGAALTPAGSLPAPQKKPATKEPEPETAKKIAALVAELLRVDPAYSQGASAPQTPLGA